MISIILSLLVAAGALVSPAKTVEPVQAIKGVANFADPSHGIDYLAMRLPRGTDVRICGDGGCLSMTVNDYGPAKSTGDIADIALVRFAAVCDYTIEQARRMGECEVVISYGARELPPTDIEEGS
jgi:hypothetical protein